MIVQTRLKTLSNRDQLGFLLNDFGLTGKFAEIGVLHAVYSADLLKKWKGARLYCIDPWKNQDDAVYFDSANKLNMDKVFADAKSRVGSNPRCTMLRMMSLHAAGKFENGELEGVYLDGNHAVDAVRQDLLAWWPKVRIGGIVSGHDFNTRYDGDTNSDALTAVMELAEAINVRPHICWCTSWFFIKTKEADDAFRAWQLGIGMDAHPQPIYSDNKDVSIEVVMPIARFDWNLAVKNLKWIRSMGCKEHITAYCTHQLTEEQRAALAEFSAVVVAEQINERGYFGSCNQMFKGALEHVERTHPGKAMLWLEADAIPMHPTWVDEIAAEYRACGRPFMGDIYRAGDVPHMSGNAVYHPDWRKYAPSLAKLGCEEQGWDSLAAHDIVPRAHPSKTIQQIWRPPLPITSDWATKNIRPTTALFHQCKDGSLIDVLCDRDGIPHIPLAPALCASTYETQRRPVATVPAAVPPAVPRTRVQQVQAKHAIQPPRFDGKGRRVG